jgi:Protein of unknown function (DUF1569)
MKRRLQTAPARKTSRSMPVNTKQVQGRRRLRFTSLDAMLADAEQLVAAPRTRMLGNWPLDQLLTHLTLAMNSSIDGISARAPWFVRLVGPVIKRRILTRGMTTGFNLPKQFETEFFPAAISSDDALEKFRAAVGRVRQEKMTAIHPVFGRITHDEWMQLHLRHAELHLSFAAADGTDSQVGKDPMR